MCHVTSRATVPLAAMVAFCSDSAMMKGTSVSIREPEESDVERGTSGRNLSRHQCRLTTVTPTPGTMST